MSLSQFQYLNPLELGVHKVPFLLSSGHIFLFVHLVIFKLSPGHCESHMAETLGSVM